MSRSLLIAVFFLLVIARSPIPAAEAPGPPKVSAEQDTLTSLSSLRTCLGAYRLDNQAYPSTDGAEAEVGFLKRHFWPIYIRWFPSVDGWNAFWSYRSDGERYLLISPGPDGTLDGDYDLDGLTVAAGDDILLVDGRLEARADLLDRLKGLSLYGGTKNPWSD